MKTIKAVVVSLMLVVSANAQAVDKAKGQVDFDKVTSWGKAGNCAPFARHSEEVARAKYRGEVMDGTPQDSTRMSRALIVYNFQRIAPLELTTISEDIIVWGVVKACAQPGTWAALEAKN